MKINEFINSLGEVSKIIPEKSYIPLQDKIAMARDALDKSIDDSDGFINLDHTMADMYFYMSLVSEYFGVEIEDVENDYDALMSIDFDIYDFLVLDVGRAYKVFEREKANLLAKNSIEAQVAKVANVLVGVIEGLANKLDGSIENFDVNKIIPDGVDVGKLMEFVNKYK